MDDPWANAWGEPATTSTVQKPVFPVPQAADDEEDITIPAWEIQAPSWSDDNNTNSLWGGRSPALDKFPSWQSPYDDLLAKPSSSTPPDAAEEPEQASEEDEEEVVPDPEPVAPESPRESPIEQPFETPFESLAVASPVTSPVLPPHSPPGSPDAFGTFETGFDKDRSTEDPWSPSNGGFVPDAADSAWGAASTPHEDEEREDDAPVDEWEAAKQQKATQDKHVPPELLASILLQFTELSNDLFPPLPTPKLDPDDYRANRHKGLQGIDSLNPNVIRLLPTDLTLPPQRPFLKSAIAKQTAESLRLSRSASFVRFSPLSHYSATKGSTAWEASVKRRPEPVGDVDLLPPGWRVVEKKDEVVVTDKKKTGHGGLLSFFGRRAATPPVVSGDGPTPRSASPAPGSSPRASMDSVRSPTLSAKSPTSTSPTTSTVVSPTTSTSTPPPAPPLAAPILSQTPSQTSQSSDTFETTTDPPTPSSAPSRVSRFLGRFGRKSSVASTGPQNLALSEGDFDFLADIEGGAAGPSTGPMIADTNFSISGALLDDPVPLPAKLAPPPRPAAVPTIPAPMTAKPIAAAAVPTRNGEQARRGPDITDINTHEFAIFGTYTPPPTANKKQQPTAPKSFAPPLVSSSSTPAPTSTGMSPVENTDIDFSAWGFDDEEPKSGGIVRRESEPVAGMGRPAARQSLNTRAVPNARGGVIPPPRRAPTAIMSSGSSKPAVVPKLDATFGFPPPPRTQTQTPTAAPILPPPPGMKAPAAKTALLDDDEDEFSGFHTPPISPPTSGNALYDTSFSSSTSSSRALFASTSSVPTNLFDDFDDFMQASPQSPETLRTPSPPRLPAKSPRFQPPAPLSFAPPAHSQPSDDADDTPLALIAQESKAAAAKAANHQRARSLVEGAAARSGVLWPAHAPPSPIPEAIAPPPNGIGADPFGFDFRGSSSMQSQQAAFLGRGTGTGTGAPTELKMSAFPPPPPVVRALSPPVKSTGTLSPPPQMQKSVSAPAPTPFFPPPPGHGAPMRRALSPPVASQTPVSVLMPPPQNGLGGARVAPKMTPTPPPAMSAAPTKSSGGLSASDLSFFEGL
ncbi:hypothetical protein C8F04DRAFT_1394704 [Mycena alexandri]|uniref:Uncharacterized protein n=1 Tax=Mycena alexandri TaxID=1745969 RepID=A0AAD6T0C5_9AGAR|nr:hypothetical protein C8F04DRAFT_1394704 [Mycena alexandri]